MKRTDSKRRIDKVRSRTRAAFGIVLLAAAACGVENEVVGGRCRAEYVLEDGACVLPAGPGPTAPEPGNAAGPSPIEVHPKAGHASTTQPIVALTPPSTFDPDAAAVVVPPDPPDPVDASVDAPDDALVCAAPLVVCHGQCISVESDPDNCGACGKRCPSNICIAGVCQGATPGDVVLIGHGFGSAWSASSQAKILRNAVAIPTTDPVRVASFEADSDPASTAVTNELVRSGVGRQVALRPTSATELRSMTLSRRFDVVILHDGAGVEALARGTAWAASLEEFVRKGGVVVAIDSAVSDMPLLLRTAGLLSVTSHVALSPSAHLTVSDPADVVGTQVVSPYATTDTPVAMLGVVAGADVNVVVRERTDAGDGLPIVIHRVVR